MRLPIRLPDLPRLVKVGEVNGPEAEESSSLERSELESFLMGPLKSSTDDKDTGVDDRLTTLSGGGNGLDAGVIGC